MHDSAPTVATVSMRVPTINVSAVDLSFIAERDTSIEEINDVMKLLHVYYRYKLTQKARRSGGQGRSTTMIENVSIDDERPLSRAPKYLDRHI